MYYNQYHNAKKNCNNKFSHDNNIHPELSLPKTMRPIIPEPKHRVGPKGIVSSGISFRKLPEPSLKSIYDVCQHYESKCGSGNYTSLASRYLSQMSNEVKSLINSIENEHNEIDENGNACQQNNNNNRKILNEKNKKIINELKDEMNQLQILLSKSKDECKHTKQKAQEEKYEYKSICKQKVSSDRMYHESLLSKVKEESYEEVMTAKKNVERMKQDAKSTVRVLKKESNDKSKYCKSIERIIQEQHMQEKELRNKFRHKLNEVGIYFLNDNDYNNDDYYNNNAQKRREKNKNHYLNKKKYLRQHQFKNQSISNKVETLRGLKGAMEKVSLNMKYKDLILDEDDDDSVYDDDDILNDIFE